MLVEFGGEEVDGNIVLLAFVGEDVDDELRRTGCDLLTGEVCFFEARTSEGSHAGTVDDAH